MKKTSLLKASLLIFAFVFSTIGNAFAIDILQLYIDGATYDSVTETWVTPSSSFTLWAIGNVDGPGGKGNIDNVRLSAAFASNETGTIMLTPTTAIGITDPSTPGTPSVSLLNEGTIPQLGDGSFLPTHGIYGTGTNWYEYSLGDFDKTDSPIGDFISSYPSSFTVNAGQINAYRVDITGEYSSVHFDLYDHYTSGSKVKYINAPFSHDGEGGGSPVPEPATLSLLGLGLVGLLGFRKKTHTIK